MSFLRWPMAALEALSSFASAVGTLWIFGLMMLIGADVLGRQLFNSPVLGVTEIVSQSIVGIVFLQLADAQRRGRMIRSDIILAGLLKRRPAIGRALLTFHNLAGTALMTLLCYFSFPRFMTAWRLDEYVGSFGNFTLPVWPFIGIVVLASAMSTLYYLNFVLRPRLAAQVELASPDHG